MGIPIAAQPTEHHLYYQESTYSSASEAAANAEFHLREFQRSAAAAADACREASEDVAAPPPAVLTPLVAGVSVADLVPTEEQQDACADAAFAKWLEATAHEAVAALLDHPAAPSARVE